MVSTWRQSFAVAALLCSLAAAAADAPLLTGDGAFLQAPEIPNTSQAVSSTTGLSKSPNAAYFMVGTATFLAALGLMVLAARKLNYLTEPEGLLQLDNPQAEDEPIRASASANQEHPGNHVDHRMQQVLVAWVFIIGSISFFLDVLAVQASFSRVCHWFGMGAAFLWLLGFLVHFHWQISVNVRKPQIVAAFFKVAACIMMQVHPLSMIIGLEENDSIVWWPALAALTLWHIGNVIGCCDYAACPPIGTDRTLGMMAYCNLSLTELWIDTLATTLLVSAALATCQWEGNPKNQLVATNNGFIVSAYFGGALMWLTAACVKCEWCNGFRNCSHQVEAA